MKNWKQGVFAMIAAAAVCGIAAQAQTDVAVSGYGTFTTSTSGSGTQQTPANSVGGMVELRHIVSPLVGFEGTVAFNPANQSYAPVTGACGYVCGQPSISEGGKLTLFNLDWVASIKAGKLRPFVLAGLGLAFTIPGNNTYSINTVEKPDFVYGGGVDWSFAKHLGLRLQVRANTTRAPQLIDLYPATGKYTQIYDPAAGVFYRF